MTVDEYLAEFDSWIVGTAQEKRDWRAELAAHFSEAASAGDLHGAMQRLGSPRQAAITFRESRPLYGAPRRRRLLAAAIDAVPLLVAMAALVAYQLRDDVQGLWLMIPPPLTLRLGDGHPTYADVALIVAHLWSVVGLGLLEGRTGRTPGKALLGLRTVSTDGIRATRSQALRRRLTILAGPLVWLDSLPVIADLRPFGRKLGTGRLDGGQRLIELFVGTMVVEDPARDRSGAPESKDPVR